MMHIVEMVQVKNQIDSTLYNYILHLEKHDDHQKYYLSFVTIDIIVFRNNFKNHRRKYLPLYFHLNIQIITNC